MLLCNNDETINVYVLPEMTKINTIRFDIAVNYASVSPDGRKLVAVGDSSQVYLFDITGNDYRLMRVLSSKNFELYCFPSLRHYPP